MNTFPRRVRMQSGDAPGVALLGLPGYAPTPVRFRRPFAGRYSLLLLALVAVYLLGADLFSPAELNGLGPVLLLLICLFIAGDLVRNNALMIVSPLFWLFVVSAAYYGWGAMVFQFGNQASIMSVHGYYSLDQTTLYRTNLLNAVGLLVVALTFSFGMRLFPLRNVAAAPVFDPRRLDHFILACLLVGAPIRYFVVPLNNSMTLGFFLPSLILNLHFLVIFALMLMLWARLAGERKWDKILFPLLAWEILVRANSGGKMDLFLLLLPIFLGAYMARPRFAFMVRSVVVAVVVWLVIVTTSGAVRQAIRSGEASTLTGRLTASLTAFDTEGPQYAAGVAEDVQRWWTRLCYAPSQGFCLDSYDQGRPGDTFKLWFWAFVPRMLVPSKPEMTVGRMFNIAVTGNPNSKSAPGAFADAYWNGGWLAVVGVSALVGSIFAWLTHVGVNTFLRADYRWLPLVWSGIVMGLRIDSFFVDTYLGSWPIALASCALLYALFPHRPATAPAVAGPRGAPLS